MVLDKESTIPLYYQLAERLREQMQVGELQAGDQLPSERELSESMGVSRMTARQALAYLIRAGLLVVKPGIGTFVAEPKLTHDVLHLFGFSEETARQGSLVTSTVLEQAIVKPPMRVVDALQLAREANTVKIVRLRQANHIPLLLETSFISARLCPGLEHADLAVNSLYALLEQTYGLHLQQAHQTFEATLANSYEQQLFNLPAGAAMLLAEGIAYSDGQQPVEYFKAIYRGDRFKFTLESRREHAVTELQGLSQMRVVLR